MVSRPFTVIIHDVTPRFADELAQIQQAIQPILDDRFACAVVPKWHGEPWKKNGTIDRLITDSGESLLHGLTHFREHRPRLVSLLTHRSDELGGMNLKELQPTLDQAQECFESIVGVRSAGLLPPAWQLDFAPTTLDGFDYLIRFGRIECCHTGALLERLATRSFDWGWVSWASRPGAWLGEVAQWSNRNRVPSIAIHPLDVKRGYLPVISRLLQRLLESGYTATLPCDLAKPPT